MQARETKEKPDRWTNEEILTRKQEQQGKWAQEKPERWTKEEQGR